MKIGILGAGRVGQALGGKLASVGNQVMLGTRDPSKLTDWLNKMGANAKVGSFIETAAFGEILFNATSASASLDVLKQAGEVNLRGKILIDLANPMQFSPGKPVTLFIANTDSLAEQIQRAYPNTKVVKTLNTVSALLMADPSQLANGDHDLFISGNDAQAKAQVTQLLQEWFGWQHVNDLGDITSARAAEMYEMLWARLRNLFGTGIFNIKVVR